MNADEETPHDGQRYGVRGGRDAFRLVAGGRRLTRELEGMDADELRRQQLAMRSFTESVEMDAPPPAAATATAAPYDGQPAAPGLSSNALYDHEWWRGAEDSEGVTVNGGMRNSSTVDTIIEVVRADALVDDTSPVAREAMGETQKYVMSVPGPGHVDQELELHASLLLHADDERRTPVTVAGTGLGPSTAGGEEDENDEEFALDAELRRVTAMAEAAERALRDHPMELSQSADAEEDEDEDRRRIRDAYNRAAAARPRPTTPTAGCATDDDGFLARYAADESSDVGIGQRRIHVSIPPAHPQNEKRRSTFSTADSYVTPRWKTDTAIDLLETNPEYARNAPRPPVVHRRASVDWESFADGGPTTSAATLMPSSTVAPLSCSDDAAAFGDELTVRPMVESQQTAASNTDDRSFGTDDSEWFVEPNRTMADQQAPATNTVDTTTPPSSPATVGNGAGKRNDDEHFVEDVAKRLSIAAIDDATVPKAPYDADATVTDATVSDVPIIAPVRAAPPPPGPPVAAERPQAEQFGEYGTDCTVGYGNEPTSYEQSGYYQYGYNPSEQQPTEQPQYGGYDTSAQDYSGYGNYGGYDPNAYNNTNYGGYGNYDSAAQNQQPYSGYGTGTDSAAYSYDTSGGYSGYGADYGTTEYNAEGTASYGTDDAVAYSTNDTTAYGTAGYDTTAAPAENVYAGYDPYAGYGTPADPYSTHSGTGYETSTALQYDNTSQQQYGDVTVTASLYGQEPNSAAPTAIEQPPPAPLLAPLLPPQRARTPDPFSWEAQATAYETYGTAVAPPRPPPFAPSPTPSAASAAGPGTPSAEIVDSQTPTTETVADIGSTGEAPAKSSPPPSRPKPPAPSRPPAPPPARPAAPSKTAASVAAPAKDEDEDPWERFKKMSEQAANAVKSTAEQLKTLSETTSAKDIKDESYLAQVGGSQGFELNTAQRQILHLQEEKKKAKAEKKRQKAAGRRSPSPTFDPKREEDLERQTAELVKKMAANRADLADWKPPTDPNDSSNISTKLESEVRIASEQRKSSAVGESEAEQPSSEPENESRPPAAESFADFDSAAARAVVEPPAHPDWADFSVERPAALPTSDSDFFARAEELAASRAVAMADIDEPAAVEDPFAPSLMEDTYDPFDIRPAEEMIEAAKQRAAAADAELDVSSAVGASGLLGSHRSSPTPEGGSPASSRPTGFDDDFHVERGEFSHTPTPLYDEDDTLPLADFAPAGDAAAAEEGWSLMLRHPLKKKIMTDRFWKPCHVRIRDNTVLIYNDRADAKPVQEILLQATYLLSGTTLQAYDEFGKIHTIKLQHVLYKERVGIRPGQISRLVEGHVTKYGLPLEHAAQTTVLAKFGSLDEEVLASFIRRVEDVLFHCPAAKRQSAPVYKQDEVQIHCYDEYRAHIDRDGQVGEQRARVRFFCLGFLSGAPFVEVGLNDRRRDGKEIVRRKDILPMYTERWIRFEAVEFHAAVDQPMYERDQMIRFQPPDGCFFEVMRFRVRPPKNREKSLTVKAVMKIAGSKIEISVKAMAAAQTQRARGTLESTRTIPCEDIQIRFPIPESWIYIFREERHWGVGSVHSKTRRTGKVKNLRDRLMGTVQHTEPTLIEVAIGEAKYEHLSRSLVWRIGRLPEKHHDAYKTHILKCRFELSSFDLMPEDFKPTCDVDFTMPLATVSNTVVRSVAIEQHEDSDRVEKFVRYVAKCQYKLDIDYVHCNDLDEELANVAKIPELAANESETARHASAFDPDEVRARHAGYGIDEPPALADAWAAEQNGGADGDDNTGIELQGYGGDGCVSDATATINGGSGRPSAIRRPSGGAPAGGFGAFAAGGDGSSSSDDEDEKARKVPMVEINMQGYGY